ncbi:Uncharacterised protein [Streptococcus pneumoniae]|nr:Uncharacterised protein [Streptococcus pneumoniae]
MVEHSGLVHDHPLAAGEPSVLGGSAIGASGLGVGVAGGEARPYAVIVPAPSVRVHERRHARGGYAEFFMRDLRGAQRRCHHPRRSAVMRRDFNCDTQHRGLACACCALHDHERIGRCDGGSSLLLPRIDTARLRRLAHVGVPRLALRHSCGDQVAQLGLGLHDAHRGEMRHMLGCRSARGEHGETIFQRQPRRNGDEVAQLLTGCAHPGLGDDLRGVLLHGVPRPRRAACRATVKCARCDLLHRQLIQRNRLAGRGPSQGRGVVAGLSEFGEPGFFFAQGRGLLRRPLVRPCLRHQPRRDDRPHRLAGMRGLPFGFEAFQVPAHLLAALTHQVVIRLQFDHFTGDGIEGEAVPIQHLRKLRMRRDHRGAEGSDRALLAEDRGGIERPPLPGSPHPRPDLHVDVPVRVTGPGGAVRDADHLHMLDRHHLLLAAWADPRHRMQRQPPPNLRQRILLRTVQRLRYLGVQRCGDRQ